MLATTRYPIILDSLFLLVILVIGFFTSYDDFKTSKIKNKWIVFGLLFSFFMYLLAWILFKMRYTDRYFVYYFDKWCINLLVSMIVAYSIWLLKLWGAGDAKLFICYAALIPLRQYSKVYYHYYFASFFLLLAIFIPPTIFILIKSVSFFIKSIVLKTSVVKIKEIAKRYSHRDSIFSIFSILIGYIIIFISFKILSQYICGITKRMALDYNILILISMFAFKKIADLLIKKAVFMLFVFLSLLLYLNLSLSYTWSQLIVDIRIMLPMVLSMMVLLPIFNKVMEFYTNDIHIRKTTSFAHWMFLGALMTWFSKSF